MPLALAILATPGPVLAQGVDDTGGAPVPTATGSGLPQGIVPGGTVGSRDPFGQAPVRTSTFFDLPFDAPVAPAADTQPRRAYEFFPSIGGQIYATDNVFPGSRNSRADIVTSIQPEIRATADTLRLQGSLSYAPSLRFYASGQDETRVDHRLNTNAIVSVIPGSLFLDLRGNARVVPVNGGFAETDSTNIRRNDRSQTVSFAASPYYLQRFGSVANAIVGYTYQYSRQGGASGTLDPDNATVTNSTAFFRPQDFSSHTGFAAVRTGEAFGRVALEARVSGTEYEGTGVLDGAHRAIGVVEGRYAFSRGIIGIAEVGYEDQEYGGTNPLSISEPVWGAGVRLEPNADSSITVRVRRRDGFTAPQAEFRWAFGANLLLTGTYADRLGTVGQRDADLLATTAVDADGQPYDVRTGGPSRAFASESLLALQSGLFRNRIGNATLAYFLPRDTLSLSFGYQERIPVSAVTGTTIFRQESTSIALGWSRSLSEATSLLSSISYGRINTGAPRSLTGTGSLNSLITSQSSNAYTFRVTLAHRFNQNLAGSVQYLITNRQTEFSDVFSRRGTSDSVQNAVIVSVRQAL
ncbi:TIGR03016 family PEP-CTERM system-associated outer membrane protein [Roseomonas sp. CCTCC AB2023176]|uniref:TIGR03016 family PEP-CTERM system-associated outer membrane protein n=1 Tax=Roseomonas sp. CCTCC AB2023176 TaxID=3342640 RepID=UPI0035DF8101